MNHAALSSPEAGTRPGIGHARARELHAEIDRTLLRLGRETERHGHFAARLLGRAYPVCSFAHELDEDDARHLERACAALRWEAM